MRCILEAHPLEHVRGGCHLGCHHLLGRRRWSRRHRHGHATHLTPDTRRHERRVPRFRAAARPRRPSHRVSQRHPRVEVHVLVLDVGLLAPRDVREGDPERFRAPGGEIIPSERR